jgi:hypothetical protein
MSDGIPKFTPGPWKFDDAIESFGRPAIVAENAGRYSAHGPVCLVMKRHGNYRKNALLISCAPEMYALLEEIASYDELHVNIFVSAIQELLAKARGEVREKV